MSSLSTFHVLVLLCSMWSFFVACSDSNVTFTTFPEIEDSSRAKTSSDSHPNADLNLGALATGGANAAGAPAQGGEPSTIPHPEQGGSGGTDAVSGALGGNSSGGAHTSDAGAAGIAQRVGSTLSANCASNAACSTGEYCKKPGCASDVLGVCALRPTVCTNSEEFVCGCDGFTYFNSCLAARDGTNVAQAHACGDSGVACSSNEQCKTHAGGVCAFLYATLCPKVGQQPSGVCWVTPDTCGPSTSPFNGCFENQQCISACNAAKSGKAFVVAECK